MHRVHLYLPQLVLFASVTVFLVLSGCAIKTVRPNQDKPAAMTLPVQALYNDGAAAFQAGELQKAQEKYQAGLEQARSLGDEAGAGFSLAGLGSVYGRMKKYPPALEALSAALPYFRRTKNQAMEGLTLVAIGEIEAAAGRNTDAINSLELALAIGEDLFKKASEQEKLTILKIRAKVLDLKAKLHEKVGQFDDAVRSYRRSAIDYGLVGEKRMAGLMSWAAALILSGDLNQPAQAIEPYIDAIDLLEATGMVENANSARILLGSAYYKLNKRETHKKATKVFAEALRVAERQGLSIDIADAHLGLAQTFEALAEFDQALMHYQAMLTQHRKIGDDVPTRLHHGFLGVMGKIYRHLGRYEEAIQYFRAALLKLREIPDETGEANVSTFLAEIHFWVADSDTAIQYYKRALELYRKVGDTLGQINVLSALGEAWLSGKVPADQVVSYFENARKLLASFDEGLDLVPLIEQRAGENKLSRKELMGHLREKFSSLGRWPLMVTGNLYQRWGRVLLGVGRLDEAIVLLEVAGLYHKALNIDREVVFERAKDWYYLGEAHRLKGTFNVALNAFRFCEKYARAMRSPEIHWAYSGLARTYADLGDMGKAVEYYKKGLSILESIQSQQGIEELKIGVFEGGLYAYRGFIPLLLNLYRKTGDKRYLQEAFQYNERKRARTFLEIFSKSRAAHLKGQVGKLATQEEKIRIQVGMFHRKLQNAPLDSAEGNRLLDRLEELRESSRVLQQEAAKESTRYSQVISPKPVTVQQVQSVLDPDTALLEYSVGDQQLAFWIITAGEVHHALISLKDKPLFERFLKALREPLIGSEEISNHIALGKELYRVLLGPAEKHLRGKKKLIIAPDGPLYYLPFEALIMFDAKEHAKLADVPYLIKQFQVSYIPSASVLVAQHRERLRQQQIPQLPLVAFGDPIYREENQPNDTFSLP